MNIEQREWTETRGWTPPLPDPPEETAQLALIFGAQALLHDPQRWEPLRRAFPRAHLFGCSTAGEICGTRVSDDSLVVTTVRFHHTQLRGARVLLSEAGTSFQAGVHLARALPPSVPSAESGAEEKLAHVLVLSDGLAVNGSDLVRGLTEHLPEGVTVTGGLAADGPRFGATLVFWDSRPEPGVLAVLGFYGRRIKVGYGSLGGWDPFGPYRLITRSKENVLYELDGHSALGLYKKYLGDHAQGLPATGLLFPLSLRTKTGETGVVRTILSVDEHEQSMTFAGDVPEGAYARLMKANFDRLIDGAVDAAKTSCQALGTSAPELAILISCVGRKLVLRQRVEEEVEGVRDILPPRAVLTGFYSYGEISPFTSGAKCELHNQTMTITLLAEE
jgi:hypothetical protein